MTPKLLSLAVVAFVAYVTGRGYRSQRIVVASFPPYDWAEE